jgi:hypothetical protein
MTAGKSEAAAVQAAQSAGEAAAANQQAAAAQEPTGPIDSVVGGSGLLENLNRGPSWPSPTMPQEVG